MKQTLNAQMGLFNQSFHIFIALAGPKNFVLQNYVAISGKPVIILCFPGNPKNSQK